MEAKKRKVTKKTETVLKKIKDLVMQGYTSNEMAEKIGVSKSTIEHNITTLMIQKNCANRIQLAVKIALGE